MEHNIEALKVRFKQLLDFLRDECNFAHYLEEEESPEDIYCEWKEFDNAANHYGIWVGTGATKFVIGDDDHDYVIKIQPPAISSFDYCGREVEVYNEAVAAGYADKFAWTAKLFDYDFSDCVCLPIYVMEWCQCSYDMIDDEMDDWHYTRFCSSNGITKGEDDAYERYTDSRDNCDESYSERMLEWAFDCWGGEYSPSSDFVIFMRNMFINDIHAGNWGWCNNRLVLVDYSGYGENYDERSINY
jgi:hypothetical protein